MKNIQKKITAEQFQRICKKFNGPTPTIKNIKKLDHGDLLARIINPETGITTDYFLKKIYIRKFTFPYSCHKNIRKGKELLISSMYLPPVKF